MIIRACSILIYVSFRLQFTSSYSFLQLLTSSYSFVQLLTSLTKVLHLLTSSYISLHLLTSSYISLHLLTAPYVTFSSQICFVEFLLLQILFKKTKHFLPKKIQNKYVIELLFWRKIIWHENFVSIFLKLCLKNV